MKEVKRYKIAAVKSVSHGDLMYSIVTLVNTVLRE